MLSLTRSFQSGRGRTGAAGPRHLPTSDRCLAGFPHRDKYAHDADTQGGRRGVMFTGLLAVLIVGTLAGSVEADRGDWRYRTPDYPRYSRDYYDGYGGSDWAHRGGAGRRRGSRGGRCSAAPPR